MSSGLLILRRFTHDTERGLTGILGRLARSVRFADMLRECHVAQCWFVWRERHPAYRAAYRAFAGD